MRSYGTYSGSHTYARNCVREIGRINGFGHSVGHRLHAHRFSYREAGFACFGDGRQQRRALVGACRRQCGQRFGGGHNHAVGHAPGAGDENAQRKAGKDIRIVDLGDADRICR